MPCKLCKIQPVWKFTNQRHVCSGCFVKYFEKKVLSTIRKYNMPIYNIGCYNIGESLKAKIINNIIKGLPQRKGKLSVESLDEISNTILYSIMYGNTKDLKKLAPKNQPLYFLSNKEILLYAKIKKIKGNLKEEKKTKKIDGFIKKIEEKNPDIRHNIVTALLKTN